GADRLPFVVQRPLDLEAQVEVALAVQALAGAAPGRSELRELRLPEAQDVRLRVGELADFLELVEQLAGDCFRHRALPPARRVTGAGRGSWLACYGTGRGLSRLARLFRLRGPASGSPRPFPSAS